MARTIYMCPNCGSEDVRISISFKVNPNNIRIDLSRDDYEKCKDTSCNECGMDGDTPLIERPEPQPNYGGK